MTNSSAATPSSPPPASRPPPASPGEASRRRLLELAHAIAIQPTRTGLLEYLALRRLHRRLHRRSRRSF